MNSQNNSTLKGSDYKIYQNECSELLSVQSENDSEAKTQAEYENDNFSKQKKSRDLLNLLVILW